LANAAELGSSAAAGAFKQELSTLHARGLIGGGRTADETISLMLSTSAEVLRSSQRADQIFGALPEAKQRNPGFGQFVPAVANVMESCETVDQSVSDILNLWAAHSQYEEAAQYFRDALGFLRGQLWQPRRSAEREIGADRTRKPAPGPKRYKQASKD
jgi:hypothetical protein